VANNLWFQPQLPRKVGKQKPQSKLDNPGEKRLTALAAE
jgi:hypothetical protein